MSRVASDLNLLAGLEPMQHQRVGRRQIGRERPACRHAAHPDRARMQRRVERMLGQRDGILDRLGSPDLGCQVDAGCAHDLCASRKNRRSIAASSRSRDAERKRRSRSAGKHAACRPTTARARSESGWRQIVHDQPNHGNRRASTAARSSRAHIGCSSG